MTDLELFFDMEKLKGLEVQKDLVWSENRRIKMPIDTVEVDRRATYHTPTEKAITLHQMNRQFYSEYAKFIANLIVDCREASVAQTNLEQVMFWVNAAIARNHDKL